MLLKSEPQPAEKRKKKRIYQEEEGWRADGGALFQLSIQLSSSSTCLCQL